MAAGYDRPQFVLFGSSIVEMSFKPGGWGAILAHLYDRKADVIVRGYAGWNSRNAVEVLNQIFPKGDVDEVVHHPALVVVYFGGNDAMQPHPSGLGAHVPLPEYIQNMKKIALHLKSLSTEMRMIFLTSPPVDEVRVRQCYGNLFEKQERTNEACHAYSKALIEIGKELEIKVIDLWTAFQRADNWGPTYLVDGIHLTAEGSKLVAKELLKAIREAKWEPSLYWTLMETEFSEDSSYYPVGLDGKTTINVSRVIPSSKLEWLDDNERNALTSNGLVRIPF